MNILSLQEPRGPQSKGSLWEEQTFHLVWLERRMGGEEFEKTG